MGLSPESLSKLQSVVEDLRNVVQSVARDYDILVTCGHRGEEEQHEAFIGGSSKLDWPHGPHNGQPSRAIDIYMQPVDLDDTEGTKKRCNFLAGVMMERAKTLGVKLRWGGDWNNGPVEIQRFEDLPHFEIAP